VHVYEKVVWDITRSTKDHTESLDFYGRLYRDGEVNRVVAAEHTGLLNRDERAEVEASFKKAPEFRQPWILIYCPPHLPWKWG